MVEFEIVSTDEGVECIAELAREIWRHHYTQIIGVKQVEYMLANFQTPVVIKSQIVDGAEYYLVKIKNNPIGYIGLSSDKDKDKLLLSKLYVKSETRGQGTGRAILDYVERKCIAENLSSIWLTVNKMNDGSIKWYTRRGFTIVDDVKVDVGSGFFMDDYIMEKKIHGGDL